MQALGFDSRQISDIPKILGSILHLGNIKFANKYKKAKEELDLEFLNKLQLEFSTFKPTATGFFDLSELQLFFSIFKRTTTGIFYF
uniref:Myosin motor domain-containing protein n=1 Tax=Glossina pallidipes TaxID=7398 RepID=A0A1B0A1G9_GLOPL